MCSSFGFGSNDLYVENCVCVRLCINNIQWLSRSVNFFAVLEPNFCPESDSRLRTLINIAKLRKITKLTEFERKFEKNTEKNHTHRMVIRIQRHKCLAIGPFCLNIYCRG